MKLKSFIKIIILLLLSPGLGFAENETTSEKVNWVPGIVQSIQQGPENSLVSVAMPNGETFNFSSSNEKLQGIDLGDSISAKVVAGWVESIEKLEEPFKVRSKKEDREETQWVSGKIIAIQEGEENSLIRIKMDNKQNFNVAISNDLLKEIDVGNEVTVKINKGWAENIAKSKKD